MYTEPMALTDYIHISMICIGWVFVACVIPPLVAGMLTGLFLLSPVINQHRWETLLKWLPINSLYLGPVYDNCSDSLGAGRHYHRRRLPLRAK